jgi:hypothetical protein
MWPGIPKIETFLFKLSETDIPYTKQCLIEQLVVTDLVRTQRNSPLYTQKFEPPGHKNH